jgi:hypothetical protein
MDINAMAFSDTLALMLRNILHEMKQILIFISIIIFSGSCVGQTKDFDTLVKKFKESLEYDTNKVIPPLIYKGESYTISLNKSSLGLSEKEIVIKSPNENADFPVSFSVIYKDNIISLFEPGVFVCHQLKDFSRNYKFEELLNTKRFDYQWLIDNKLHAVSNGRFWYLDSLNHWSKLDYKLPFDKQPKLYENNDYLAYCDCHGEWGGTVYFYNRKTEETYFTEATCANSIIESKNGFQVLSHLGHMMGTADLKLIKDPTKLTNLKGFKSTTFNGSALGYADSTKQDVKLFDYWGLQIFSSFRLSGQTYYIIYFQDRTFLATIENNNITIVDPLFNSDLYTHDPISIQYGDDLILINLDFWGIGREREVSMIVIQDKEILKLDWNKKH